MAEASWLLKKYPNCETKELFEKPFTSEILNFLKEHFESVGDSSLFTSFSRAERFPVAMDRELMIAVSFVVTWMKPVELQKYGFR